MEHESLFFTNPQKPQWKDYELVIPAVSISNVGQMAVDMLLFNLGEKIKKVSDIYDDAVLPAVGRDPNGQICNNLEVFESEELKLVIIQQRAPFVKGRIPIFRQRLINWIKECEFGRVVMLSSVSSHVRTDKEINDGSQFRFLCVDEKLNSTFVNSYGWLEYSIKKPLEHKETLELPGSGMVKSFYEDCTTSEISFAALLVFCNQGDATIEIQSLLNHLRKSLKALQANESEKWKLPPSWKTSPMCNRELMIF